MLKIKNNCWIRWIAMLLLITPAALVAFGQLEIRDLAPGQTFEREMIGAQTDRYRFNLQKDEFFQVRVEQQGVDVALTLKDASGRVLTTMDSPNGKEGPETLSYVAEKAGIFTLEVGGFDDKAEKGIYVIKREGSRTATANDKLRVAVEKSFVDGISASAAAGEGDLALKKLNEALQGWQELKNDYLILLTKQQIVQIRRAKIIIYDEASKLFQQETVESYKAALPKFLQASRLLLEIDDKIVAGVSLANAGLISDRLGNKAAALEYYTKALPLFQAVTDKQDEARTLNNIGKIHDDLGDKHKAIEFYMQSLPIARDAKDIAGQAITLDSLGRAYKNLGEHQKSLEFYNQSLPLARVVGDKMGEAVTLNNIAHTYGFLGEYQKAIDYSNQSLSLSRILGDKKGEAVTLNIIGLTHSKLGDKQKAIEYYNQSLLVARNIADRGIEEVAISNLGAVYSDLGEWLKALEFQNQSLLLARAIGDKKGEARVLFDIGQIYSNLDENQKALESYNQSLLLSRAAKDKKAEFNILNDIGKIYADLGVHKKALEYYSQSLLVLHAISDQLGKEILLDNVGQIYSDLGENQKSLEYYNQSLPAARAAGNKMSEVNTLNNLAKVYSALGEKRKSLEFYNQSLTLVRATGNQIVEADTLDNIGEVYSDLGEKQKAFDYYNQSLLLKRSVGYKAGESAVLMKIGGVYTDLGDKQKSLMYYNQSLLIARAVGGKTGEAQVLSKIMATWESLQNSRVAVFYGKQSVNKYQDLREAIKGLDKDIQKTYLKSVEDTYRKLADLLIEQGSFAQAEQVLAMLKQEEYFAFVRRDAGEVDKLGERVPLDEKEKALIERSAQLAGKILAIEKELTSLVDKKRRLSSEGAALPPEEQIRYDELKRQLAAASADYQLFFNKEIASELGRAKTGEIEIDQQQQANLRQWGAGTVALYTVAGADRYRVVLTTPKAQVAGKTEIKIADLNKKVFAFRDALQNPKIDPRPLGKELYDILVKPIEKELKAANAKTLVWSLDGTLRYIPLAALSPDGKRYLVEDMQNVVITTRSKNGLSNSEDGWKALGLGVSEPQIVANPDNKPPKIVFGRLEETERELTAIVRDEKAAAEKGLLPGRRFMNDDFTSGIFKESLAARNEDGTRKFNLVHIASHFRLGSSDSNSFILLGSGQILTLEEIRRSPAIDFSDVELITLSACSTGLAADSNGREVDSLAAVVQAKNAKAVLATLWAVNDKSTSLFMIEFYRLRKQNSKLTKAEAIQSAQRAVFNHKNKAGKDVYKHPYYWSSFVLIGDWR